MLALLTDPQVDRIIDLCFKIAQGVGYVVTMVLPLLILRYQKRNVTTLKEEVKKSSEASSNALEVANGHNAKLVELSKQIAAVVQEKKTEQS